MSRLFGGAMKDWRFVLNFCVFSFLFWAAEFAFQYFGPSEGQIGPSLYRSFGLAGATFFGLSLLSSSLFRFRPALARYWTVRRAFGVVGFLFIALHVLFVTNFLFEGNPFMAYYSLNPFENPLIFGAAAFYILLLVTLTSTDWAVQKLGGKWKAVQRLVYFAFMLSIFHFISTNPAGLLNLAGYFLLLVTALALLGELYWFIQVARQRNFKSLGTFIGLFIILLYIAIAYLAFFSK
ncbi:MAG: ferric reductase-like transmembrane domain-containing protein [Candidatus Diapherotrites archaeon]|uniref:Ferric reductase-like transmembrane domain-containing protein n=1 Tax=Candidatus Iainarchaeum sp. TaxID=3101447 RepID=A0A8T3YKI1_9ARCH|nr:ferric reductase-like transmembrane domain-containing protein [Candidatus Diapherotrites archaeon]